MTFLADARDVEEKAAQALRDILHSAEENAPALEAVVADGLHEAGIPAEVASAFGVIVKFLRELVPAQPVAQPEPVPDPGVPAQ